MKKLILVILLALLSVGLFASRDILDTEPHRPFYNYTMFGTGYTGTVSNYDYIQSIPFVLQAGTLHNSKDGKMALGFGMRLDVEFGFKDRDVLLSMDLLTGLDMFFRLSRNIGIDVLLGFAFGMKDVGSEVQGELLTTIGPGASASLRLTPSNFSGLSFDIGLAAYGNFGVVNRASYAGVTLTPFVGLTVNLSAFARNRYFDNIRIF